MNKRENMDEMAVRRMEVPNAVLLGQVNSEEELTATLLEAYEVDEETARKDVAQVLAKWGEIGLLA